MPRGYRRSGVDDRVTDDSVAILGAEMGVGDEYAQKIRETEKNEIDILTMKDYRRRIGRIIDFLEDKFPEYYEIGVRTFVDR